MKAFLIAILLTFSAGFSFADMIAMSEEEIQLHQKLSDSPTQEEVVAAFNSQNGLVYLEAVKWLILNRDIKTWNSLKSQKSKLKGNAYYLYPLLDFMAETPPDPDTPLILALKPEHLKMLAKKGEELPPRYEYSYYDPPLDELFYELLSKDLQKFPASNIQKADAVNLLDQYQAPLKKTVPPVKSQQAHKPANKSPDQQSQAPEETISAIEKKKEESVTLAPLPDQASKQFKYWPVIIAIVTVIMLVAVLKSIRKER